MLTYGRLTLLYGAASPGSGNGAPRDVPIPDALAQMLAAHRVVNPGDQADPVFPYPFTYGRAQKVLIAHAPRPNCMKYVSMISGTPSRFMRSSPDSTCPDFRSCSGTLPRP